MSLNQSGAQSNKPLGGGEKAEASITNRILYGLLAVLIIVFVWRMVSNNDSSTVDIPKEKNTLPHFNEAEDNEKIPNVDVEIEEMETPVPQTSIVDVPEVSTSNESVEYTETPSTYTSKSSSQSTVNNYSSSKSRDLQQTNDPINQIQDSYSYIYTGKVEMPSGTFRGLDANGFAITKPTLDVAVSVSRFDEKTGNLIQIPEEQLDFAYQSITTDPAPKFTTRVESVTEKIETAREIEIYPSTGIAYGTDAYPLDDTLAWHPYESLPYMREEKETFVAEKVRNMPTADELEPNIHPSTLGDRDTRMGFGVVIRPNK